LATCRGLNRVVTTVALIALSPIVSSFAQDQNINAMPRFRLADVDAAPTTTAIPTSPINLLADENFAPWSFKLADGTLTGISVELARSACVELGLTCTVIPAPHDQLLARLGAREAEMIVTGLKISDQIIVSHNATKPYFRSMARFVKSKATTLPDLTPRDLAGQRIGVVKNTSHHLFLQTHYSRSALIAYDTAQALYDAMRQAQVDVAFGDAIAMGFWMASPQAQNCCDALGKALLDFATFSRPLVFLAHRDQATLRDRFDDALDNLESKGQTAEIFQRFLPLPIW
jgi:polar amino acid transport system substrate-binding protein